MACTAVVLLFICWLVHASICDAHLSSGTAGQQRASGRSRGSSGDSARNEEPPHSTAPLHQQQAAPNLLHRLQAGSAAMLHAVRSPQSASPARDGRTRHRKLTEQELPPQPAQPIQPAQPAAVAVTAAMEASNEVQAYLVLSPLHEAAGGVADAAAEPLGTAVDALSSLMLVGQAGSATATAAADTPDASLAEAEVAAEVAAEAAAEAAAAVEPELHAAEAEAVEPAGQAAATAAAAGTEPVELREVLDTVTGQKSWQYVPAYPTAGGMAAETQLQQQQQQMLLALGQEQQDSEVSSDAGEQTVDGTSVAARAGSLPQPSGALASRGQQLLLALDPQLLDTLDEATLFSLDQATLDQLTAIQTTADGRPLPTKSSLHKGHPKPGGPNIDFGNVPPGSAGTGPPYGQDCDPAQGLELGPNNLCECMPGFGVNQDKRTCSRCPDGWFSKGGSLTDAYCRPCPQLTVSNRQRTACVTSPLAIRPNVSDTLCRPCNYSPFQPPACCNRAQECCGSAGCCGEGFCVRDSLVGLQTPYCCLGPACPNDTSVDDCCLNAAERCVTISTTEQRCCRPQDTCGTLACCRRSQTCCNNACIERATSFCCGVQTCAINTQTCCNGQCCTTISTTAGAVATSVCLNNNVCCAWQNVCFNGTACCAAGTRCINNKCCSSTNPNQVCLRVENTTAGTITAECCLLGRTQCTGTGTSRKCCPIAWGSAAIVCPLTSGPSALRDLACCDSRVSRCPNSTEPQVCIPRFAVVG